MGDSIRMGYGPDVEAYFKNAGYDFYQPQDNCRFAKYFLRMLFDDKEILKDADIIYFNIGHWDLCQLYSDKETFSSIEEYRNNLIRIVKLLFEITPKLIFATTTPVRPENPYNDNKVIDEFNNVATSVMKEYGVIVDDLNGLLRDDIYGNICEDNIHLSEQGIAKCRDKAIKSIERLIN